MGKSLKNAVAPDDIYRDYGADTLRLYEMFMGPLDASRPWNTADIIGVHRFLQRLWRNVDRRRDRRRARRRRTRSTTRRADCCTRTIDAVRNDMATMGFNTAIARLFELNNHLTQVVQQRGSAPREVVTPLVLMVAPLAPHIAEELWARLGHTDTLAYESFPTADPALLVADTVEVPVQVGGKVRSRITVPGGCRRRDARSSSRARTRASPSCSTAPRCAKVIVVPGRLVNFVV